MPKSRDLGYGGVASSLGDRYWLEGSGVFVAKGGGAELLGLGDRLWILIRRGKRQEGGY